VRSVRLTPAYAARRNASTSTEKDLKETLKEVIPVKREMLKKLKAEHGQKSLGEVKVENAIGGMRSVSPPSFIPTL
jgi:citrate synthase